MDRIFLQILNMSITASYVIIFVMLARLLLKKAPKILSYSLWSVVLFRLIFPFSFKSVFSLISINTKTIPDEIIYAQTPKINSGIVAIDRVVNNSLPAATTAASVNPIQIWIGLATAIWIIGIIFLVIYSIFTTIRLSKKLKSSRLVHDNIYITDNIKTPFVFGIINPKIYLPNDLSEIEKPYIIKHEQTHIKRFDHIIKFVSFVVVSIHWFNPLVWIGFFLMSEDMELSCDERVIKEMGHEIKKEYSSSLLSLSTGRRIVGGSPLAFGENNTKGRIKNILNYKKPRFWISLMGIIIIVVIGIGLLSNPKEKETTRLEISDVDTIVVDHAKEFIDEQIAMYEDPEGAWQGFKIIDSKITKLEKVATFDNITTVPIEIWALEFRLKPDDITKVAMAGGMQEEDGWITDDSSMGKPYLAFTVGINTRRFLTSFYPQEFGFDTLAKQEVSLLIALKSQGLIPTVNYGYYIELGNHLGEKTKFFLYQPVVQGDKGIWAVGTWEDKYGNTYHDVPDTDLKIEDYYKELQEQYDNGINIYYGDPMEVAIKYLERITGESHMEWENPNELDPDTLDEEYYFEPIVSTIEGTLITRLHYGPPNYGENPDTDAKHYPFILQLDQPIDVTALKGDIHNSDISGVTEIQVVPNNEEETELLKQYIDKHIGIQGTLFEALHGGHYTDVLINIVKILD